MTMMIVRVDHVTQCRPLVMQLHIDKAYSLHLSLQIFLCNYYIRGGSSIQRWIIG